MSKIKCGNLYKTIYSMILNFLRNVPFQCVAPTWWKTSLLDDANSEYRLTE